MNINQRAVILNVNLNSAPYRVQEPDHVNRALPVSGSREAFRFLSPPPSRWIALKQCLLILVCAHSRFHLGFDACLNCIDPCLGKTPLCLRSRNVSLVPVANRQIYLYSRVKRIERDIPLVSKERLWIRLGRI